MKALFVIIISVLLYLPNQKSEAGELDSLIKVLPSNKGIEKADVLNKIASCYGSMEPEKCLNFANRALELSLKLGYKKGEADSYVNLAWGIGDSKDPALCLEYYRKAFEIFKEENDIEGIAKSYLNFGIYYINMGNIKKALEYYKYALDLYQKLGNQSKIANIYLRYGQVYNSKLSDYSQALINYHKAINICKKYNIKKEMVNAYLALGLLYYSIDNLDKAIDYLKIGLNLTKELGDKIRYSKSLWFIAEFYRVHTTGISELTYSQQALDTALQYAKRYLDYNLENGLEDGTAEAYVQLGEIYKEKNQINEAFIYYQKGFDYYKKIGSASGSADSYYYLAGAYDKLGKPDSAIVFYKEALKYYESINDYSDICLTLSALGLIYSYKFENFDKAKDCFEKSLVISRQFGYDAQVMNNYDYFYQLYRKYNKYEKALEYYEKYTILADSLDAKKKDVKFELLITNFEAERKLETQQQLEKEQAEKALQERHYRNNLQYMGIMIFVIALFIGLLFMGRLNISSSLINGLVFITFLLVFEFILVFIDPTVENVTNSEPLYKLMINAGLALLLTPLHKIMDGKIKPKFIKKIP